MDEPVDDHDPNPHDLAAERAVLGAMMLEPIAAARGTEILAAEDFYRPAHTAIFDAIGRGVLRREPTDAAAVAVRLGPSLTRIGGAPYLHDLISQAPIGSTLAWYAQTVTDRARMRRLIEAGTRITQLGRDTQRDPGEAAAMAAKYLAEATDARNASDPIPWAEVINPAMRSIERASKAGTTPGLTTGVAMLDTMIGGLRGGQLIIVAGRPGMGKSQVAGDWARRATIHSARPACVFSLEMGRDELYNRIISAETGVSLARITRGHLTDGEWTALARRSGETEDAPLYLDDSAPMTLHDIITKARRLHARTRLSLIVIDYLQLVTLGGRRTNDINREREVSEISRGLKLLAKELNVPVVAAAQLNRNVEQRHDKRPVLSDLRESGSVEQDSDIVVMLYRDDYYNAKSVRPNELDMIVTKHRGGPQGTVVAIADFAHGRIKDPNPQCAPWPTLMDPEGQ
ncbi:MAG TPA: replicative DNA helicase [Micromonosporaceae bacterium]|nr:replicative DNA helicase [Micromonosporaceae bacterium]